MAKIARGVLASFIPALRAEDELPIASVHDISSAITPNTVASLRGTFDDDGITMDDFVIAMVKVSGQERPVAHLLKVTETSYSLTYTSR